MPPKVEVTGSDYFSFVSVRIENEVGTYVIIVEDSHIVMKREIPPLVGEIRLPEFKIVFEEGYRD